MSPRPKEGFSQTQAPEGNGHDVSWNKAKAFEEQKRAVISRAFWARQAVLQESHPEAAAHYWTSEENPDRLWTPLIVAPGQSVQHSESGVMQIRLFRFLTSEPDEIGEPEEPDTHSTVCEIRHGRASGVPHPGQNSRHGDYSVERTMDGGVAHVLWDGRIYKTDHADITQTEQDLPYGVQEEAKTRAVNILGEMSHIINTVERAPLESSSLQL